VKARDLVRLVLFEEKKVLFENQELAKWPEGS